MTDGLLAPPAALPRPGGEEREADRIVYDLDGIRHRYDTLRRELPGADIRFAMKACPVDDVLRALLHRGAGIDAASVPELHRAQRLGAPRSRTHYGNTVVSDRDIADAHRLGVTDFAADSLETVAALARHAPGARVYCRLMTTGRGALWALGRKFGCSREEAVRVLEAADRAGLRPSGLSVHVGSQQTDPAAWRAAFDSLDAVLTALAGRGPVPDHVNLGGGLPALGGLDRDGEAAAPPIEAILRTLREGAARLRRHHGERLRLVIEPGRHLVADHGTIHARALRLTRRRLPDGSSQAWLYLSVGRFNGLYEMDALRYPLRFPTHPADAPTVPAVVAGPSCDSDDAYPATHAPAQVPVDLASGDPVHVLHCGAYAVSYMTEGFNGFAPLPRHCTGGVGG
ncbi:alanine racemase [Streptomyces sp. P38-E01]|uniref:Alanine racemase n=1 Tax=Streptomyces tardus TaxID=2780544 RepID=A0A949JA51_9ACTN|nr:alanine racemase [Streptomyces tardus]MBU7596267.1 alanine racemase [Streptomyces tardus]